MGVTLANCPRDGAELPPAGATAGGRKCGTCSGIYLESAEAVSALRGAGVPAVKLGGIRPLPPACPGCGLEMEPIVAGGIEIDLCSACGSAWLDAGELENVNAYLVRDHSRVSMLDLRDQEGDDGIFNIENTVGDYTEPDRYDPLDPRRPGQNLATGILWEILRLFLGRNRF